MTTRKAQRLTFRLARREATTTLAFSDIAFVGVRFPLFLVSLLTPSRWDRHAARLLWKASRIARPRSAESLKALLRRNGGDKIALQSEALAEEHARRNWESYWGWFRAVRPRKWRVAVRWEGEEHLARALGKGSGVVLWFYSFCDNVIMLRALAKKGYRVVHLSRIRHGAPSRSFFGLGPLAGLVRSAENRYLDDRVILGREPTPTMMRRLAQALAESRCVTIRGDQFAPPGVPATLFDRRVQVAPGAPSLAWKTGATVLTIGLRRERFGEYVVRVDPPIPVDRSLERKRAIRSACAVFTERLEQRIEASPADWTGWRHVHFLDTESDGTREPGADVRGASQR